MADELTRDQVKRMPVVAYSTFRPSLKTGDLLFCSGEYLVSRMISGSTNSPWSHVGIVFSVPAIDRVLLLESVEDVGVRLAPLSKYIEDYEGGKPYKGPLVIARSTAVTRSNVAKIAAFGTDELTRPYDKAQIGEILARIHLGIGRRKSNRAYICSELVAECFARGGINFEGEGGFITPQDVWIHRTVRMLARVQ